MNTNKYAIIIKENNELHTITIHAEELMHVVYITRGLLRRGGELEAVAVENNGTWKEVV